MDLLSAFFPATPFDWALQVSIGVIGSILLMSFMEYFLHGHVMHRKVFPDFVYKRAKFIETFLHNHVVLHHGKYFKQFNHEPDERASAHLLISYRTVILGLLVALPFMALYTVYVSIVPPLIFISIAFLHRFIWNTIHTEMHHPVYPYWSKWEVYKFLARYHYLHHNTHRKNGNVNYNVVLPIADYVMGKVGTPTEEQRDEMRKFGYL